MSGPVKEKHRRRWTYRLICGTINKTPAWRARSLWGWGAASSGGLRRPNVCRRYLRAMLHQLRLQAIYQRPAGSGGSWLSLGLVEPRRCGPPMQATPIERFHHAPCCPARQLDHWCRSFLRSRVRFYGWSHKNRVTDTHECSGAIRGGMIQGVPDERWNLRDATMVDSRLIIWIYYYFCKWINLPIPLAYVMAS